MVSSSEAIRKFERMFPGIKYENDMFEKDLLAGWRMTAEHNRQWRDKQRSEEIAQNLNNWERVIIGTYHYDFENGKETYIPADKKSNKKQ